MREALNQRKIDALRGHVQRAEGVAAHIASGQQIEPQRGEGIAAMAAVLLSED